MRSFTLITELVHSRADVFDMSLDIDAHVASMSSSSERAVGGVVTGRIGPGESVTWSARHFGVRWRMTSAITAYERPSRFVDEQTRGPFRTFRHEHIFTAMPGGTRMTDTITLGSPVFGFVVDPILLVPYLRRLIRRRNEHIRDALDAH